MLAVVLLAAIGSSTMFLVKACGLHLVKRVEIMGAQGSYPGLVDELGKCVGRTIWHCGADSLSAQYLVKDPSLKRIRTAVLPWGKLLVWVESRKPVARIKPSWAMDEEGVIFRCEGTEELPELKIGGSVQEGRLRAITAILSAPRVDREWQVEARDPQDIKVIVPGPYIVHLGNGLFPEKWRKFWEIWESDLRPAPPGIIDLRYQGQAIFRRQV